MINRFIRGLLVVSFTGSFLIPIVLNAQSSQVVDWLKKGQDAFKAGKYTQALKFYNKSAAEGNQEAEFSVGLLYCTGQGAAQDRRMGRENGAGFGQALLEAQQPRSRHPLVELCQGGQAVGADQGDGGGAGTDGDESRGGKGNGAERRIGALMALLERFSVVVPSKSLSVLRLMGWRFTLV